MKLVARSLVLVFLLWVAAIHCSSSAHGFVVVVNSDIPDLDEVRISVFREGEPAHMTRAQAPQFPQSPLTLGVTSDPGDRVHIDVTGFRNQVAVVSNSASATVVDGDQKMLVLDLCRACEGFACNGNFVCIDATTCAAPGVDSSSLLDWSNDAGDMACQPGNRPPRESSQTTAPPPVAVPTGDGGDVPDAGMDGGPGATSEAGTDAGFSCAICPSGAPCNEAAKTCEISSPPKCAAPLDVTKGGTFTGSGCAEVPDGSKKCSNFTWSYVAFVVNALPVGKHLVGVAQVGAKEIQFSPYTGSSCAQSFGEHCADARSPFEVHPNTRFVLGQRGSVCDPYTLTLTLADD